ncbi:Acryloyl-CoA reductase (NADH) [Streptomyces sp. ADI96-02]|uniref:acyl-CoA dehydrogenase family protein n=1 Tax=Streptomyces sp. ADI96-02 TaxID=1522760 RepID=UPI000F55580E|nr:acyl-CoA dehydrogenase family protein [Streptomyces sp. ADI96-02]RPK60881.1 Acryloyl-CoA reductase (NADH) [Streptomyces sp. ADI96-02]
MDLQLSDDQRALRTGMRDLLAAAFDRERMRAAVAGGGGVDRVLWRELGAAGLFALRLPQEAGGVGLGLPEAVLLLEEAGRSLLPGPLVATQAAAGAVAGAAEGEAVVAVLDGDLPVADLAGADALLVAEPGGPARLLTGADLRALTRTARPVRSLDPLTPLHRVAMPPPGAGEPTGTAADRLRDEAALLTAAEQLGSAAHTTEMAVQHAGTREQFGAPIGSFQAVKHLCADMHVRTGVARAAVYAAALTGDRVEIAGAKLLADEAAVLNARDCLQIHGGTGFTWEADVHLHLKRAWLRSARWLAARAAEEVLAAALDRPADRTADRTGRSPAFVRRRSEAEAGG